MLFKGGLTIVISVLMRVTCKNLLSRGNIYLFTHTAS